MRKKRRQWLRWALMTAGVYLPYAAHSRVSVPTQAPAPAALASLAPLPLQHVADTAIGAAQAVELAQGTLSHIAHSTHPDDALADCRSRWGQDLGPVLCPAMFTEGKAPKAAADVEVRLLGALWHLAGRNALGWWQASKGAATSLWIQARLLAAADDAP